MNNGSIIGKTFPASKQIKEPTSLRATAAATGFTNYIPLHTVVYIHLVGAYNRRPYAARSLPSTPLYSISFNLFTTDCYLLTRRVSFTNTKNSSPPPRYMFPIVEENLPSHGYTVFRRFSLSNTLSVRTINV